MHFRKDVNYAFALKWKLKKRQQQQDNKNDGLMWLTHSLEIVHLFEDGPKIRNNIKEITPP